MNKTQSMSRGAPSLLRRAAAIFVGIACGSQLALAQDYVEPPPYSEMSWLSWRSRWNGRSGAIGYGPALTRCVRIHQKDLPVSPPLYGPGFGYHQTCWRQISPETLCGPCDTLRNPGETYRGPGDILRSPGDILQGPGDNLQGPVETFRGHEETTLPSAPSASP